MKTFPRKHSSAFLLMGLLLGFGGWCGGLLFWHLTSQTIEKNRARQQQAAILAETQPAPTAMSRRNLQEAIAFLQARRADLQSQLFVDLPQLDPLPTPEAYYLQVVETCEELRSLARKQGVSLAASVENFGISRIILAGRGPDPQSMRLCELYRHLLTQLISALFAARPQELVTFQIHWPKDFPYFQALPDDPEVFQLPAFRDWSSHLGSDSLAFRIEFSGQTQSLRSFLQLLAAAETHWRIRGVECRGGTLPHTSQSTAPRSSAENPFALFQIPSPAKLAPQNGDAVPLVSDNRSRFTVTLQVLLPFAHRQENSSALP